MRFRGDDKTRYGELAVGQKADFDFVMSRRDYFRFRCGSATEDLGDCRGDEQQQCFRQLHPQIHSQRLILKPLEVAIYCPWAVPPVKGDEMRFWKAVLGIGAACAACCTAPVAGGIGALVAGGATTLAAARAAMLPCVDELAPLSGMLFVIAAGAGAMTLWKLRRPRASRPTSACGGGCHVRAE